MRIMIYGGEWIDPEEIPIVIELTEQDKFNLSNMAENATLFSAFPKNSSVDIGEWLQQLKDQKEKE